LSGAVPKSDKQFNGAIMPDGSNTASRRSIVVSEFTSSVLDPDAPMLGPVENGGTIIAKTAPGC
jgi:formamidase